MDGETAARGASKPKRAAGAKTLRLMLVLVAAVVLTGSVYFLSSGRLPFETRIERLLNEDTDSYRLVAVYAEDKEEGSFVNGVHMAIEAINASDKLVLGKKLILERAEETGVTPSSGLETTVKKTMTLSDRVVRTDRLAGVIGHEWSDSAVTASSIYASNNILYLATHATATSLTNHGFETVFALQPDNATNAYVIASYALSQKLKRVIVLSDKSDYGKESANFFSEAVSNAGADIVYRGYLSGASRSVDDLLMFVLDNELFTRSDFDAFFIVSSSTDQTAEFIKRARYLGLNVPILGMETMFSAAIEEKAGKEAMKDTAGVSLYDRDNISESGQAFIQAYQERYGHLPDLNSALGYDAVNLVRDAVERAGSFDSGLVSDTLKVARYKKPFEGVTGPLVFDRNGAITDTEVFVVRHNGEEFHTVASFKVPLNIGSTQEPGGVESLTDSLPSAMETLGQ